jgi:hypothetical protein
MYCANWSTRHDCIDQDRIVIRSPSLDECERIPGVNVGFEPKLSKPLHDQDAGLIVSAMPIPTADDLHTDDLYIE